MTTVFEVRLMTAQLEGGITGIISAFSHTKYPTDVLQEQLVLIKEIADKLKDLDK